MIDIDGKIVYDHDPQILIIDSAEQLVGGIIRKFGDLGYVIVRAAIKPVGDYAFGKLKYEYDEKKGINNVYLEEGVLIERKTVEDFDSSFANGNPHMWDQSQRLREWMDEIFKTDEENTPKRFGYLFIIGDETLDNPYAHIGLKHRIGAIGSIMSSYLLPTTIVSDELSFVLLAHKLFRKYTKGEFGKARKLDFTPSNYGSFGEYVLSGIPGIKGQRAEDILEHFVVDIELIPKGIIKNVAQIKGIGPKTLANIREALD